MTNKKFFFLSIFNSFLKVKVIHAYKNYYANKINLNQPVKFVLKNIPIIFLKLLKKKNFAQVCNSKCYTKRYDNSNRKFFINSLIIIKKKFVPKINKFLSISLIEIKNKKILLFFKKIF